MATAASVAFRVGLGESVPVGVMVGERVEEGVVEEERVGEGEAEMGITDMRRVTVNADL